ncbi:DUF1616 domain-containing protein [Halobaculum sp. P14]|uniref:DUF1616 domain-containing protein n=1 Tax=Halobaculum sp. P14 TaxID=3421638 RepID=UPI003EBD6A0C
MRARGSNTPRQFPVDLALVAVSTLLTAVVVAVQPLGQTPIRLVLGAAFLTFVPGYAFVAALFPESAAAPRQLSEQSRSDPEAAGASAEGISGLERVVLSFVVSVVAVPLVGIALRFTAWGVRLLPFVLALGSGTLVAALLAARRRRALPPEQRFAVPWREWISAGRAGLRRSEADVETALTVLLACSLVLAASSVAFAAMAPQSNGNTNLYLLTENASGAATPSGYPSTMTVGEPHSFVVGVGNHERERTAYTVVVELNRVAVRDGEPVVTEQERLRELKLTVPANETRYSPHRVTPTMSGSRLRLTYLLYRGEPPANSTVANAYRETHYWVNVTGS